MKNKQLYFAMLMAGLSLGTAWAIRGQFGHEHGAAWAGAIGALSILLVSKRTDWYSKIFSATVAGAIGWGLGGLMSYGIVVGYGRDNEFVNVYYGLLMLFVIGGLYGFVGGGLFGLTLSNSSTKPVNWPQIIIEMVVGAIICYFFMIEEFKWLMTPPRSELWAACFGSALALTWNMARNHQYSAIRVAVFAGLGGGFGFAFGNFLQVLGNLTDIHFNFWNVMEYSLGFFGGLGMAYGTFTSEWEQSDNQQTKNNIWFPLLMVALVIPFIVWEQSFDLERIQEIYSKIEILADDPLITIAQYGSILLILILTIYWWNRFYVQKSDSFSISQHEVYTFFLAHWGLYVLFSLLITGAWINGYRIEQYLYIVNWIVVAIFIRNANPTFTPKPIALPKWTINFGILLAFFAVLAFVLINSHPELKGAHKRFGAPPVLEETK